MTGALVAYDPDGNLSCGGAEIESGGLFDVDNIPPWDTWVHYAEKTGAESLRSFSSYVIAWIPPHLMESASTGIEANPEHCIAWLRDLRSICDSPVASQLVDAGLAG